MIPQIPRAHYISPLFYDFRPCTAIKATRRVAHTCHLCSLTPNTNSLLCSASYIWDQIKVYLNKKNVINKMRSLFALLCFVLLTTETGEMALSVKYIPGKPRYLSPVPRTPRTLVSYEQSLTLAVPVWSGRDWLAGQVATPSEFQSTERPYLKNEVDSAQGTMVRAVLRPPFAHMLAHAPSHTHRGGGVSQVWKQ